MWPEAVVVSGCIEIAASRDPVRLPNSVTSTLGRIWLAGLCLCSSRRMSAKREDDDGCSLKNGGETE